MTDFEIKDGVLKKYRGEGGDVTIPAGVTEIGPLAFAGNTKIKAIIQKKALTAIGREAFAGCTSLRTVVLADVLRVGRMAFRGCTALIRVEIKETAVQIAEDAFWGCTALRKIVVDGAHPSLKAVDGALYTKDGSVLLTYPAGREDTAFAVPDGVTEIGDGAFRGARALRSLRMPKSLQAVGAAAFDECPSLCAVYMPEGVAVANGAFHGCPLTATMQKSPDLTVRYGVLYGYTGQADELTLPEGIAAIELDAFSASPTVNRLALPASLLEIEEAAFSYLASLDEITVAEGNAHFKSEDGILTSADGDTLYRVRAHYHGRLAINARRVGAGAAFGLSEYTELTLGAAVREIGDYAFMNCEMLERVEIADDHTGELAIGEGAFMNCPRLARITCPAALAEKMAAVCPGAEIVVRG